MSCESIKLLLEDKIGLNPVSVGESSIQRAIHHRLAQLQITDLGKYHSLLLENNKELCELIEEIVVPETWFFRNKTPFEAFNKIFNRHILPGRNKKKKIRILSVPCSTGEEPYSLAMILHEHGMNPKDVEIMAVDISLQAIEKAKRAIYSENAFRDTHDSRIKKYFEKHNSQYHLTKSIQKFVKFKQSNVFSGSLSPYPGYFDAIFCRNLLIYFGREKQQIVLEKLHRALKKNGALFVGHAEPLMVTDNQFSRLDEVKTFSFLKVPYNKHAVRKNSANTLKMNISKQLTVIGCQLSKTNSERVGLSKTSQHNAPQISGILSDEQRKDMYSKDASLSFRRVEKLISEKRNQEALVLCEKFLEKDKHSAQGHYLLALLKCKSGEIKKAQSLLKKTIYLDQNHKAALILSSELARQDGDIDAIASYQRRIDRLRGMS